MPELPEVETIRRGLVANILNKNISNLDILKSNLVKNSDSFFKKTLLNNKIKDIDRIGKLLIFKMADDKHLLLIHLKMTGQLVYVKAKDLVAGGHNWPPVEDLPNRFSYIIFGFKDGSRLFFNDMRQFGYLHLIKKEQLGKVIKRFGIEPGKSNFTWKNFKEIFINRTGTLKPLLLNQQIIAGIGNIYADEICFKAKVRPDRKVNTLSEVELKRLYQSTQYIIKKAIEHRGTTFRNYRDAENTKGNFVSFLKVYGRAGEPCLVCKNKISKVKLGGRGTHYCVKCQK